THPRHLPRGCRSLAASVWRSIRPLPDLRQRDVALRTRHLTRRKLPATYRRCVGGMTVCPESFFKIVKRQEVFIDAAGSGVRSGAIAPVREAVRRSPLERSSAGGSSYLAGGKHATRLRVWNAGHLGEAHPTGVRSEPRNSSDQ